MEAFPILKPPPTRTFVQGMVKNLVPASLIVLDDSCEFRSGSTEILQARHCSLQGDLPITSGDSRLETFVPATSWPRICSLEEPLLMPW